MLSIALVVKETNVSKYFCNVIFDLLQQSTLIKITLVLDDRLTKLYGNFNFIENSVDRKFSNFKEDPFEIISIEKLHPFVNKIDFLANENSTIYDWIIFESENTIANDYLALSKNGVLSLDCNFIKNKNVFFLNDIVQLKILIFKNSNWDVYFSQNLKKEKGIKNNVQKLLFNYSLYLKKLILNPEKKLPINYDKNISESKIKVKFILLIYYFGLGKQIISRKVTKKKLNWKIAFLSENKITKINQPKNSFWADPFLIHNEGKNYIFFEELNNKGVGEISCLKLDNENKILKKEVIIKENYHLSFSKYF